MFAAPVLEKVATYKDACDDVLLSRGKKNKNNRTVIESNNGSTLSFLKSLQKQKK